MNADIRRELRVLRGWAFASTIGMATLAIMGLKAQSRTRFDEIDVQRINVVEPDGSLRMVLSNRPRSIGPIYKGQPFGYAGGTRPGIIFFNDEGTENGGLTFTGKRGPDGKYQASSGFSFDQFDQDQILYFQYSDNNGRRRTGFTIADRVDANVADIHSMVAERDSIMKLPSGAVRDSALKAWQTPRQGQPLFATRIYLGRDMQRTALLTLSDPMGRPRIRLSVDSLGAGRIEFLDDAGRVTRQVP